jgi:hypothetical protein
MNKKLVVGWIVVFIVMSVLEFLLHGVILSSTYNSEAVRKFTRPESEMMGMMWIYYVVYLIVSFFFTLIFSKGYEGKGIVEGVRYGLYMGLLMATPMAYASYAMLPMPYSLALSWFISGIIEYIILGIVVAMVYGKKEVTTSAAS